jgi:hypothetical protein
MTGQEFSNIQRCSGKMMTIQCHAGVAVDWQHPDDRSNLYLESWNPSLLQPETFNTLFKETCFCLTANEIFNGSYNRPPPSLSISKISIGLFLKESMQHCHFHHLFLWRNPLFNVLWPSKLLRIKIPAQVRTHEPQLQLFEVNILPCCDL